MAKAPLTATEWLRQVQDSDPYRQQPAQEEQPEAPAPNPTVELAPLAPSNADEWLQSVARDDKEFQESGKLQAPVSQIDLNKEEDRTRWAKWTVDVADNWGLKDATDKDRAAFEEARSRFSQAFTGRRINEWMPMIAELLVKDASQAYGGEQLTPYEAGLLKEYNNEMNRIVPEAAKVYGIGAGAAASPMLAAIGAAGIAKAGATVAAMGGAAIVYSLLDVIPEYTTRRPIFEILSYAKGSGESAETARDVLGLMSKAVYSPAMHAAKKIRDLHQESLGEKGKAAERMRKFEQSYEWSDEERMDWINKKAHQGFINHLMDEGHPWYTAMLLGGALEVVEDPVMWFGPGIGKKVIGAAGDKLTQQAAKKGMTLPAIEGVTEGTTSQLGLYIRPFWAGKMERELVGIRGTEGMMRVLERSRFLNGVAKVFSPAGKAAGKHMRFLEEAFGDMKRGEAGWKMYQKAKPYLLEYMQLAKGMSETDLKRATMLVEQLAPAARGDEVALNAIRRICTDPKQRQLAETMSKVMSAQKAGWEAVTGEAVPELHANLEKNLKKHIERQKDIEAKLTEALGVKRENLLDVVESSQKKRAEQALRLSEGEKLIAGTREKLAAIKESYRKMGIEPDEEKLVAAILAKEQKDQAAEYAAKMYGDPSKANVLPKLPTAKEVLKSEMYPGVTKRVLKTEAELGMEAERAWQEASQLSQAVMHAEDMSPDQWKKTLSKVLTLDEMKDVEAPMKAMGKLYQKRARSQRWSGLLQDVLDDKITKDQAVDMMNSTDKVLRKAAAIDKEWRGRIGYMPRTAPKGKAMFGAERTPVLHKPKPLSSTSSFEERVWLTESGASKSQAKIETEIRGVLSNPETLADNKHVSEALVRAYKTTNVEKAMDLARKDIANGNFVVWKIIENDPDVVMRTHMNSMMTEAGRLEIAKQMRAYSSDIPTKYHTVSGKSAHFDKRISDMYGDRYFPPEIASQYEQWTQAMDNMAKAAMSKGRLHDAAVNMPKVANSLGKIDVTGWRPGFQFRNTIDDLSRFWATGPYDPARLHLNAAKALIGKGTIDLGGKLGKISGADGLALAASYNVDMGGLVAETYGILNKGPLKVMTLPERARRIGLFFERIIQGSSPEDAARAVKKVAFSSENLAAWERPIRDYAIPFWSFPRQNIPFTVTMLFSNPAWVKANMEIFQAFRKRATGGVPEEQLKPEFIPDWMGEQAIHTLRSDTGAGVLMAPGMSITDLTTLLDVAGSPRQAFRGALKNGADSFSRSLSPYIQGGINIAAEVYRKEFGTAKSRWSSALVEIPQEFEKLPPDMQKAIGIKEEWYQPKDSKFPIKRRVISQARLNTAKAFGLYTEFKRYLKPESMKQEADTPAFVKAMLANTDVWRNMLTGISRTEVSDLQVGYSMVREAKEELEANLASKGFWRKGQGMVMEFGPVKGAKKSKGTMLYQFHKHLTNVEAEYRKLIEVESYKARQRIRGEIEVEQESNEAEGIQDWYKQSMKGKPTKARKPDTSGAEDIRAQYMQMRGQQEETRETGPSF